MIDLRSNSCESTSLDLALCVYRLISITCKFKKSTVSRKYYFVYDYTCRQYVFLRYENCLQACDQIAETYRPVIKWSELNKRLSRWSIEYAADRCDRNLWPLVVTVNVHCGSWKRSWLNSMVDSQRWATRSLRIGFKFATYFITSLWSSLLLCFTVYVWSNAFCFTSCAHSSQFCRTC